MWGGDSGIGNIPQPDSEKPVHKPSEAAIYWPNGSYAKLLSAENPDGARGQQGHYTWVDELAAFSPHVGVDGLTAFDNVRLATRLGDKPMMIVTTTPKRVQVLRDLITEAQEKKTVRIIHGSTSENTALSALYLNTVYGQFEGTAIAEQELSGVMLDEDPEGVLWTDEMILNAHRNDEPPHPSQLLTVVAIDPSVAENPTDECGIVVVGATKERQRHRRRAWVLADESLKASPGEWAKRAVETFHTYHAKAIVAESNQGHALVKMAIHQIDPTIPVILVNSRVSKKERAVPVAQLYEQKRVKHVRVFNLLETQQTTWEPGVTKKSPDRLDALVHGVTATVLVDTPGLHTRPLRAKVPIGSLSSGFGKGFHRRPN